MGMFDVDKAFGSREKKEKIARTVLETLQQAAPEFARTAQEVGVSPDAVIPRANNAVFFRGLRSAVGKSDACWYVGICVMCHYSENFDSEVVITDEGALCRINHNERLDVNLGVSVEPLGNRTDFSPDIINTFETPDEAKSAVMGFLQKILEG